MLKAIARQSPGWTPWRGVNIPAAARIAVGLALVSTLFLGVAQCRFTRASVDNRQVEHGRYLVSVLGCNDCHTPWVMTERGPEPDMSLMLSGHPREFAVSAAVLPEPWVWAGTGSNTAYAGPWGISFAANLTPDENTGLGIWAEADFIKTIRSGRHWGFARPILPPMPWHAYRNLSDRDLKAVYAFLRTIPAISNEVPEAIINYPPEDSEPATFSTTQ